MNRLFLPLLILSSLITVSCSEVYDTSWSTSSSAVKTLGFSKNEITFSSKAQSDNVTVNSQNVPWQISNTAKWLTVSPSSGKETATVAVAVQENKGDTVRHAYPELSSTDSQYQYSRTLNVTQQALNAGIVISNNKPVLDAMESSMEIDVTSNYALSYKCTAAWLRIEQTSKGIIIKVEENTADNSRNTEIIVSSGNETEKIYVTQRAPEVTSTTDTLVFSSEQSKDSVAINAKGSWKASSSNVWIEVTPQSGKSGEAKLYVSVTENTDTVSRNGFIYVTYGEKQKLEIPVLQKGKEISIKTDSLDNKFPSAGGTHSFAPVEASAWTAVVLKGSEWITVSPTSGTSKTEIVVTASDNASGKERSGEVEVTYENTIYRLAIVQSGKAIEGLPESYAFFAKGGESTTFTVKADVTPTVKSDASWLKVSQSGKMFTLTADENKTSSLRSATVTVSLTGITDLPSKTIKVSQAGVKDSFGIDGFGEDEHWE